MKTTWKSVHLFVRLSRPDRHTDAGETLFCTMCWRNGIVLNCPTSNTLEGNELVRYIDALSFVPTAASGLFVCNFFNKTRYLLLNTTSLYQTKSYFKVSVERFSSFTKRKTTKAVEKISRDQPTICEKQNWGCLTTEITSNCRIFHTRDWMWLLP